MAVKTTLLLDADIIAYKAASVNQKEFNFGDTGSVRELDHAGAIKQTDTLIAQYCNRLGTQAVIVCLTDPDRNFRKELDPSYKAHRANIEKPELLQWIKDYMYDEYRSYIRPRLEADDCMGILATHPTLIEGKKIIVSEDKDMRTIPGFVYHPHHDELGVMEITEEDANRFMLWQAVVGDSTDGYKGAPGVSDGGTYDSEGFHEGPRSYGIANEILECDYKDVWDAVLFAYGYVGLTEKEAILQVRMAHILRSDSYNFKAKKVKLWQPEWLFKNQ